MHSPALRHPSACVAALLILSAGTARAADATLSWDPVSAPSVVEYVVFWGPESGVYTASSRARGHVVPAGETTYVATGLPAGAPTYFAVVSVDDRGRTSDFSNEAARPEIRSPEPGFAARFGPCGCADVSGTAAAESPVALFADGVPVGETRADGAGLWRTSVDLTPVGEGPVALVARSTGAESPAVPGQAVRRTNPIPGDLDGDGGTGLADAILALRLAAGHAGCGLSPACEITGDGRVGLLDAVFLLQRTAGLR